MVKEERALASEKRAAITPSRQFRNEVARRSQFNVDLKPIFQFGDRAKDLVAFWLDLYIDIDRATEPTEVHGAGAAGEIDLSVGRSLLSVGWTEIARPSE